jgi:ketol-acid reductoisomerase
MAKINFGGVWEEVVTREEFPMEKALDVLKDETIAIIGYGVQGPAQALNLRDNGFHVIVGQRRGTKTWNKAVEHGWIPGETLFDIEEAAKRGTVIEFLLSDAGQIALWPTIKPYLRHHIQRADRHYSSCGCGCGVGSTERFRYICAQIVSSGQRNQLELCRIS